MTTQHPEALRLAEMLTADEWPGHVTLVSYARECVAELLRQYAENETLRAGYAAARLEIESLRSREPRQAAQASSVQEDAAHKTVPTFVDADASIGQCALGVGDGTGSLFVYGSYEAIKRVQEIIFENERLRASARN